MKRRELLRGLSLTLGAAVINTENLLEIGSDAYAYELPNNPMYKKLARPVTAITIGAGGRGNVYGNFAHKFSDQLDIVGVAEPIAPNYYGRRTRIMGSMGCMTGDMETLEVSDFRTGKKVTFTPKVDDVEGYKDSGHGGGDWMLARDFAQAVAQQDPSLLTSTIDESIESHIMGFMAEESRKKNKFMSVKM